MMELPYKPPTRQVQGRKTEAKLLKRMGLRAHPNSGAGHIKDDGSDENTLCEVKDAKQTHTIHRSELLSLFRRAAHQRKTPVYVIQFDDLLVECSVKRRTRP